MPTDGAGEASVWLSVRSAASTTLTASLAGGATVSATINGISTALAIAAAPGKIYIARNTAVAVPLLARVVSNGVPLAERLVEFAVMLGTGTLSAATATSGANGEASANLTIANMNSEVRVSACVGVPPQTACDIFYLYAVSRTAGTRLIKAGGDEQYVLPDTLFLPVSVRLNDLSDPPNVVAGAPVKFRMTAYQPSASQRTLRGEVVTGHYAGAVIVDSEEITVNSNAYGLATYLPNVSGSGLLVVVQALSGDSSVEFTLHTWEEGSPATRRQVYKGQVVAPEK